MGYFGVADLFPLTNSIEKQAGIRGPVWRTQVAAYFPCGFALLAVKTLSERGLGEIGCQEQQDFKVPRLGSTQRIEKVNVREKLVHPAEAILIFESQAVAFTRSNRRHPFPVSGQQGFVERIHEGSILG